MAADHNTDADLHTFMHAVFGNAEFQQHLKLIILASIISYGATHIVKPFFKGVFTDREKSKSLVRLFAVITGAGVAQTLGDTWDDIWYGAAAGVLNVWLVAIIKQKLEDKFHVKLESQAERPRDQRPRLPQTDPFWTTDTLTPDAMKRDEKSDEKKD